PVFIVAALISGWVIKTRKRYWLNVATYLSVAGFVALLLTGTWRSAIQVFPLIFKLLGLGKFVEFAQVYVNNSQAFHPTLLTYVYIFVLAVMISRVFVYFYIRFQSRLVHSDKEKKDAQKASHQYQKVKGNWMKLN